MHAEPVVGKNGAAGPNGDEAESDRPWPRNIDVRHAPSLDARVMRGKGVADLVRHTATGRRPS
jgi:hypothetical protein